MDLMTKVLDVALRRLAVLDERQPAWRGVPRGLSNTDV